jgi:hypothetical protein
VGWPLALTQLSFVSVIVQLVFFLQRLITSVFQLTSHVPSADEVMRKQLCLFLAYIEHTFDLIDLIYSAYSLRVSAPRVLEKAERKCSPTRS